MKPALAMVPVLGLALTILPGPLSAAESDPVATRQALGRLLAEANAPIPDSSSCQGHYGQEGKPRVRDMLGMTLAYLYAGENTIAGNCSATQCEVVISHMAGEDVSRPALRLASETARRTSGRSSAR